MRDSLLRYWPALLALGLLLGAAGCTPLTTPSVGNLPEPEVELGPDNLPWTRLIEEAGEESRGTGKPLVADVGAEWCYFCTLLDERAFPHPEVQALAPKAVWLKVDADQHKQWSREHKIRGLPTLIVFAPGGRQVARAEGFMEGPALARFLQEAFAKARS